MSTPLNPLLALLQQGKPNRPDSTSSDPPIRTSNPPQSPTAPASNPLLALLTQGKSSIPFSPQPASISPGLPAVSSPPPPQPPSSATAASFLSALNLGPSPSAQTSDIPNAQETASRDVLPPSASPSTADGRAASANLLSLLSGGSSGNALGQGETTPAPKESRPAPSKTPFDTFSPFDLLGKRSPKPPTAFDEEPRQAPQDVFSSPGANGDIATDPVISASSSVAQVIPTTPAQQANGDRNVASHGMDSPARVAHRLPSRLQSTSNSRPTTPRAQAQIASGVSRPSSVVSNAQKPGSPPVSAAAEKKAFKLDRDAHAKTHLAHMLQTHALDDSAASGLSETVLDTAVRQIRLDLRKPLPAGPGSLSAAKPEITPVALLNVGTTIPYSNQVHVGGAGELHSSFHPQRIINLGQDMVVYVQTSKCKLRIIHIKSGARALLSVKAEDVSAHHAVRSISASRRDDGENAGWTLIAVISEAVPGKTEDDGPLSVVTWHIPGRWGVGSEHLETTGIVNRIPLRKRGATEPTLKWLSLRGTDIILADSQGTVSIFQVDSPKPGEVNVGLDHSVPGQLLVASWKDGGGVLLRGDGLHTITAGLSSGDRSQELPLPLPSSLRGKAAAVNWCREISTPLKGEASSNASDLLPMALVVSFDNGAVIAIYQFRSGSAELVAEIIFDAGSDHFNLFGIEPGAHGENLLVANSQRASLFWIPLLFGEASTVGKPGSNERSQKLRWDKVLHGEESASVQDVGKLRIGNIRELSLNEPCVSMSTSSSGDSRRDLKLFAMHPNGVQIIDLPLQQLLDEQQPLSRQVVTADKQPDEAVKNGVEGGSLVGATQAKEEAQEDDSDDVQVVEVRPPAKSEKAKQKPPQKIIENATENPIPTASQDKSIGTTKVVQKDAASQANGSVASAIPESTHVPAFDLGEIQRVLREAVHQHTSSAFKSAAPSFFDEAATSIVQQLSVALPPEIARAFQRPELINRLSAISANAIAQPAQRAAIEAVNSALVPHFSEIIDELSQRAEQQISRDLLQIRKDMVTEQSQALISTNAFMSDMIQEMKAMRAQIDTLQSQNVELTQALRNITAGQAGIQQNGAQISPAVTPSASLCPPPRIVAEDTLLLVLSQDTIERDCRPLRALLEDLLRQDGSPSSALERVSQPVLLALLHRLSSCLLNFAQNAALPAGIEAGFIMPWIEVCASKVQPSNPKIAEHFAAASSRIMSQLFEAGSLLERSGRAPWLTSAFLMQKVTQPLFLQ